MKTRASFIIIFERIRIFDVSSLFIVYFDGKVALIIGERDAYASDSCG